MCEVNYKGDSCIGCFEIKIGTDATKFTNVGIAGFGQRISKLIVQYTFCALNRYCCSKIEQPKGPHTLKKLFVFYTRSAGTFLAFKSRLKQKFFRNGTIFENSRYRRAPFLSFLCIKSYYDRLIFD